MADENCVFVDMIQIRVTRMYKEQAFLHKGELGKYDHCVKSVPIRSYSGPNAGKYGPE